MKKIQILLGNGARKAACLLLCMMVCLSVCIPGATAPTVSAATFSIDFDLQSEGVILVNLDTGITVFEKNADKRLEPASITKIMTYAVVCDHVEDLENTKVVVSANVDRELTGTGSSVAGVKTGEELTVWELLNLMMVPSGNDAALALAEYVGGGNWHKFVDMMNEKAEELGCQDTHFANPHGLHDANHYTTARDMALISQYALDLPGFTEVTNQKYYTLRATNIVKEPRTVYSTNLMLNQNLESGKYYYQYAKGIKTGSHDQAGRCLVSMAVKNGYSYLCVAMGCPYYKEDGSLNEHGEMLDSRNLYEWAFKNLEMTSVVKQGDPQGEVDLEYAWNKDTLQVVASKDFNTILPASIKSSSIVVKTQLPESVEAPIEKGQKIGTATLSYAGQVLTTIDLVSAESVERSNVLHTMNQVENVVTSTWFIVVACIIAGLLILYIILALLYNRRKKKLKQVKKYRRM